MKRILILLMLLVFAQAVFAIQPGDEWDFELVGYVYHQGTSVRSQYFVPPTYPGLTDNPEYAAIHSSLLNTINFVTDNELTVELVDGSSIDAAFWTLEARTTGETPVPFGFPIFVLSFVTQDHESVDYEIVPFAETKGHMVGEGMLAGTSGLFKPVYRVSFHDAELPKIDQEFKAVTF